MEYRTIGLTFPVEKAKEVKPEPKKEEPKKETTKKK